MLRTRKYNALGGVMGPELDRVDPHLTDISQHAINREEVVEIRLKPAPEEENENNENNENSNNIKDDVKTFLSIVGIIMILKMIF